MLDPMPDAVALRRLSLANDNVDPRTILKALRGEPIRTVSARERAERAAKQWRAEQTAKRRAKR